MSDTFYRSEYTELWFSLFASEELGPIDGGYTEDYTGTPGRLTLRNKSTGASYSLNMNEFIGETPLVPHDVFSGYIPLYMIPDGHYIIEGRIRDAAGNWSIINYVSEPYGTERILTIFDDLHIVSGYEPDHPPPPVVSPIPPSGYVVRRFSKTLNEVKRRSLKRGLQKVSLIARGGIDGELEGGGFARTQIQRIIAIGFQELSEIIVGYEKEIYDAVINNRNPNERHHKNELDKIETVLSDIIDVATN